MASAWYNKGKFDVLNGSTVLLASGIKCMLVNSAYSFVDTHNFVSDVSANEISVTNYTGGFAGSGRKLLTAKTVTEDDTNDLAYFDAADLTWTALGAGATIGGAILIRELTTDANSVVLAFMDLTDTATNGGDITISWNAAGILKIT